MRQAEVQKMFEVGLITDEQRERILAHFGLRGQSSRFLTALLILGATLAAAGVVLLVAANWEEIPRLWKMAAGLAMMLGAYGGGYYLRDHRHDCPRAGEALYFLGAGLFLANIALVGQVYHLSSRLPNALLLWWAGIVALPWILRSTALHVASLIAFGVWFGGEILSRDGWFYVGDNSAGLVFIGLLGLLYYAVGMNLRRTAWADFASPTERLGFFVFVGVGYLLTIGPLTQEIDAPTGRGWALFAIMSLLGLGVTIRGILSESKLTRQWRMTWSAVLAAGVLLMGVSLMGHWRPSGAGYGLSADGTFVSYFAALVLFVICLVAVQVGTESGAPYMVNLGLTFIALDIVTTYLVLFGSMAQTGFFFVASGLFLIGLGIYLEKKRRRLLARLKSQNPQPVL